MKLLELNLVSLSVQKCCCQNCKAPWWSVGHYHSTYHVILFYFQLKAKGADLGRAQNVFFDSYWISLYTWQEKLDQKVSFSDFENSMFFGWFPIRGAYVHFKTSQRSKAILWLFREHVIELKKKRHLHLHVHVQNRAYLAVWVSDSLEEKQKTKNLMPVLVRLSPILDTALSNGKVKLSADRSPENIECIILVQCDDGRGRPD